MDYAILKDFRNHLKEVARKNVHYRRFMATKPSPHEARKAFMLATRREVEEALAFLYRTDRILTESTVVMGEMQDALTNVLQIMERMKEKTLPPEEEVA